VKLPAKGTAVSRSVPAAGRVNRFVAVVEGEQVRVIGRVAADDVHARRQAGEYRCHTRRTGY
jgi:hypothetical protein